MPMRKSDALKYLVAHHQEVEALLEALDGPEADVETLRQLAQEVSLHLTLKERVFYPSIVMEDLEWRVQDALKEHVAIRRLLAGLVCLDLDTPEFHLRLQLLKGRLGEQFQDEEHDLLPQVGAMLNRARLCEVGASMKALAKQLAAVAPSAPKLRRRASGAKAIPAAGRQPAEAAAVSSTRKRKGA